MDPEAAGAVTEAPAFSLESAFAEAQKATGEEPAATATKPADAPSDKAPDSTAAPDADADTTDGTPATEEAAKSNRQAGREAYERGLREGREAAQRELDTERARGEAERTSAAQRQQFNELLTEANLPDDGTYDTAQRRTEAQRKLGQLYASNTVTQTAYNRGRTDYEASFWSGFEGKLGSEIGLDDASVKALMAEARTGLDFARRLVDHGKTQEKAVWDQEVAKRDATIEQLRGQLAGKRPSPEAANGLRTNGAAEFDGSWESALSLARAGAS